MDISIKGMYTFILIGLFALIMTGMLVINLHNHQASRLTLSIVNMIQQENGLTQEIRNTATKLATTYDMIIEIEEITLENGRKYQVSVTFTSTVGIIGFRKSFKKTKLTHTIYD